MKHAARVKTDLISQAMTSFTKYTAQSPGFNDGCVCGHGNTTSTKRTQLVQPGGRPCDF